MRVLRNGSDFTGVFNYPEDGNLVKKSKLKRILLKLFTRPFKVALFPAASIFKGLFVNKRRIEKSRQQLVELGGEPLSLKTPDGTIIDATYMSAQKFKEKIDRYFTVVELEEKKWLVVKDEYLVSKDFASLEFHHIKGEARDFCKILYDLNIGLKLDPFGIPLEDSQLCSQADEETKPSPVALLSIGRGMSYPAYKSIAAAYLIMGIDVMMYDYPGVGKSRGSPTDYNMKLSVDTCYQYLRQIGKQNSDIIAYGHSMGSMLASDLAARRKGVHLFIDRGPETLRKAIAEKNPRIHRVLGRILPKIANFNNVSNMADVEGHILIHKGLNDTVIPANHAKRNLKAAIKGKPDDQFIRKIRSNASHEGNPMKEDDFAYEFKLFLWDTGLSRGMF